MKENEFFNPLDKINLGQSIVNALLASEEIPLADISRISGAGIYAIYYRGDFRPYAVLAERNKEAGELPIYVGKAIPKGGRKGILQDASGASDALFQRIQEHLKSIQTVQNLDVSDFSYRYIAVDDIWIPLGETLVIQRFEPLWNSVVEGFGNHDPGSGRYNGMRPLWDELHPGRKWAMKCQPAKKNGERIIRDVADYFARKFGN